MKKIIWNYMIISSFILLFSCQSSEDDEVAILAPAFEEDFGSFSVTSDAEGSIASVPSNTSSPTDTTQQIPDEQAGRITAGEWNDLENWDFWSNLLNQESYADKPELWDFYTNNRISVWVKDTEDKPVCNVQVTLKKGTASVWKTKTDNFGKAELWIGLSQRTTADLRQYSLEIDNKPIQTTLELRKNGIQEITIPNNNFIENKMELAFIVDATGSMGDELEFLKKDLEDVIQRVSMTHPELTISTSSVFYRDEGDEYVVKHSDFTQNITQTLGFIRQQNAEGGGDYPEAVHSGLQTALRELQWSDKAYTKIAFLLLDAPPHHHIEVMRDLHHSIRIAAEQGIKVIPITASGIDKETEFLMRFFAIATNGTYVFITNHSGIGNEHIEASVGDYQIEFLNDLMVRLITKYAE